MSHPRLAIAALVAVAFLAVLSVSWPAGGEPRIRVAREVAEWRWGRVCHGQPVHIYNRPLKKYIAIAVWDKGRTNCAVTYSTTYPWAWWSLCRATVHEWGHLAGAHHVPNPLAVMFPYTLEPWRPCGPDHNHPRFRR